MAIGAGLNRVSMGILAAAGCVGALLLGLLTLGLNGGSGGAHARSAAPSRADISRKFGRLPLRFEANQGQASRTVDFLARGPGYTMELGRDGAVLALTSGKGPGAVRGAGSKAVVGMHLVGGNAHPKVAGSDRLAGASNYMVGKDRSRWHTDVPSFARVRYQSVYPGVDMVYRGTQHELEYDLIVAPKSDPAQIALGFRGSQKLSITKVETCSFARRGGRSASGGRSSTRATARPGTAWREATCSRVGTARWAFRWARMTAPSRWSSIRRSPTRPSSAGTTPR